MELRRADIGFGRVIVDDVGVARRGVFRTRSLRWDDIVEYRFALESRAAPLDPYRYGTTEIGELAHTRDVIAGRAVTYLASLELQGMRSRVAFDWRFRDASLAIGEVIGRVHSRLTERARAQLAATGGATFGSLRVTAAAIGWGDRTLARDAVEALDILDGSPFQLRVMARGEALPFAHEPTRRIPNVYSALELARELGYSIRGTERLGDALGRGPGPMDVLRLY